LEEGKMVPTDYSLMSDMGLLALCAWREARGEGQAGMRAVCCVVRNRVNKPCWWGHDYHSVILHPYQFSSFNAPPRTKITDPNESKWPADDDPTWIIAQEEAQDALNGEPDTTRGATLYYSRPITFPPSEWGPVVATATIGHLSFWKPAPLAPQAVNLDAQDA
jgi:N-acetylmuramoyl-L-alanine amidase